MTLVHEATHARVYRAGIRYLPRNRRRIEQICVRAEIDFATQLPDATLLADEARHALETEWWEDVPKRERELGQLRILGVPAWLIWLRKFLSL